MIDPEKIGLIIGPGGKTIRRICEVSGAEVDINEDNSGRIRRLRHKRSLHGSRP
jgi:polyribonucleotide nucleotidyltransferase